MFTHPQSLNTLLQGVGQFVVPVFQRPYAWTQENQWEPLWLDIVGLAEVALTGSRVRSHFLGTLVLDDYSTASGTLQRRWVIDGQQRLTTIQLLLAAFATTCEALDLGHERAAISKLLRNEDVLVKSREDALKVLPRGADREHFIDVMQAASVQEVTEGDGASARAGHPVVEAFLFFQASIEAWLHQGPQGVAERAAALRNVIRDNLRIVTIDLTREDDGQLIFETLNARSEPLLPSDLAKNLLFRSARDAQLDVDALYTKFWRGFDTEADFWRAQEGRGHARRPRIDTFLFHYLTARRRREVRSNRIYPEFRDYIESTGRAADAHLEELWRYAKTYREIIDGHVRPAEQRLLRVVQDWGVRTVLPLLLELRMLYAGQPKLIESVVQDIESFIVRRQVCRLNTRGYGVLFANLVAELVSSDPAGALRSHLLSSDSEARRWPADDEFKTHWTLGPLDNIAGILLYGIEEQIRSGKTEGVSFDRRLQVEHVLPRSWEANWPLPGVLADEEERQLRAQLVRAIGNLTLLTGKLNPSVGNANWERKRKAIDQHSVLLLNKDLAREEEWGELRISARTERLFQHALARWPRPAPTGTPPISVDGSHAAKS